jgi:RND family efflux transporter MFP subunit
MHTTSLQNPLTATLGLVLLFVAGCKPANTFVPPPPPDVTVQTPTRSNTVVWVGVPGRIEARDFLEIRARVNGYLKKVAFKDGERVNAGDPLFIIEPEPFIASWEAAKAQRAEAQAAADLALVNYQRREQAYETRAISEIDKLTAKANLDAANAHVLATQAALDQALINLTYTTNTAPQTGRISRRLVSEGNLVGGAQATLLATLVVEDPVHVYFNIAERTAVTLLSKYSGIADAIERAPDMRLELADGTQYEKTGRLDYIDTTVNPETGTLRGRVVFPNPDGQLVPGLYGKILIPQVRTNAVLVPNVALQRDLSGNYLLFVTASNIVDRLDVTPAERVDQNRIIESGIEGNERVIVSGLQRARPGIVVAPTEAQP